MFNKTSLKLIFLEEIYGGHRMITTEEVYLAMISDGYTPLPTLLNVAADD